MSVPPSLGLGDLASQIHAVARCAYILHDMRYSCTKIAYMHTRSSAQSVYVFCASSGGPIARTDSGSTTMRVVIGTALIEAVSHIWKILAAVGVFSDRKSAYWDDRVFLPLSEGSNMLASGIVISVWVDVANSSMSRAKVWHTPIYVMYAC